VVDRLWDAHSRPFVVDNQLGDLIAGQIVKILNDDFYT
jgi:hypothetical protein